MADNEIHSPGTVSKILWHFTGGPLWNPKTKKQHKRPKPSKDAYRNLKSILSSNEIRLGSYKELIKVVLPERKRFDSVKKKTVTDKNVIVELESSPICCLSDIPAPHLRYHANRYGKFALGFHRKAVTNADFNPVFYTLEDTPIIQSIYEGFSSLRLADPNLIADAADSIESEIDNHNANHDEINVFGELMEIQLEAFYLEQSVEKTRKSLEDFVAFIKTFSRDEFSTIYCEREWRSTSTFSFNFDALAMIVVPRSVSRKKYFEPFVNNVASKLKVPRRIPIVPWEDLVEH